jgi:DNA-directed RNA polymerase subunit E'/Rpb7
MPSECLLICSRLRLICTCSLCPYDPSNPVLITLLICYSDHGEQIWVWQTDDAALYYDHAETVRFRVEAEHWFDHIPLGPNEKEDGLERRSPYTIEASMGEDGLGPVLWWD